MFFSQKMKKMSGLDLLKALLKCTNGFEVKPLPSHFLQDYIIKRLDIGILQKLPASNLTYLRMISVHSHNPDLWDQN